MTEGQLSSAVKAIVWDADGVLFNTFDEQGKFRWSRTIASDLRFDTRIFSQIFDARWDEVLRGERDTRTHIAEALEAGGSSLNADEYIDYWLTKDANVNCDIAAYLRPEHSFIGTNQDPLRAKVIANLFRPAIQQVFASSSMGFLKPEEGFYRSIERELKLTPDQLCLIDDTLVNVTAARSFGWRAHHFVGKAQLARFLEELNLSVASEGTGVSSQS